MRNIFYVIITPLLFCVLTGSAQNNFTKYFNEAADYIEREDYKGAIEQLSNALRYKDEAANKYKLADAYVYRGYSRSKLGNFKDALADVEEGLKLKPEYITAHRFKTGILLRSKEYGECIKSCDLALERKPGDEQLLITKSIALLESKKYADSRKSLSLVLDSDPRSIDALSMMAENFYREKTRDSANVYYTKVIELNPTDLGSYYNRGINRSYTNDTVGARLDMETAMRIDTSTKYIAYNNMGYFLKIEKQDYPGAIPYFDKAIALKPDFGEAFNNRGFARMNMNDLKNANKDIKKALDLDKTNSFAWKNMGLLYLKENKPKAACECFNKALALGFTETYDDEVEKLLKEHCGAFGK